MWEQFNVKAENQANGIFIKLMAMIMAYIQKWIKKDNN